MKQHEIGRLKDILWYLKAAVELRAITELENVHILALSKAIEELQAGEYAHMDFSNCLYRWKHDTESDTFNKD